MATPLSLPPATESAVPSPSSRLASVDFLRGLVMVLMVLDHTREFFMPSPDPTDLSKSTALLFFTRWVTHFCAPIFVFLAGTGSYFAHASGKFATNHALARYLAARGLFLIILEFTLINWSWNFNFAYRLVVLQVIWAIGMSMILLAASVAIGLTSRVIGIIGLAIVLGHNLLDLPSLSIAPSPSSPWRLPWNIFLRPGALPLDSGRLIILAYSVVPWFGVMALGFGFGEILDRDRSHRIRSVATLGIAVCLLFLLLRSLDAYGDSRPWSHQPTTLQTLLSFLNCQKYPPSLIYLTMTLGPGLLILAGFDLFERQPSPGPIAATLINLGRAPLLYYLLQWPLIHLMANIAAYFSGQSIPWNVFLTEYPPTYGYSLPFVYLMWSLAIAILYFPTRWFANYKRRHRNSTWLSYF